MVVDHRARIGKVLVVGPFETAERGPIICCDKDGAMFVHEFHEVTGAKVRLARLPNGADVAAYRAMIQKHSGEAFAKALGVAPDFDAVIFGRVVEHDFFQRAVHGVSADITMEVEAFTPDGRALFKASSRVQYSADSIAEQSAKVIALHYMGKR